MDRFVRLLAAGVLAGSLGLTAACQTTSDSGSGPSGKSGGGHSGQRPADLDGIPTGAGTHALKLDVGTIAPRSYRLHLPASGAFDGWTSGGKPKKKLPLVLALHGGLSTGAAFEQLTGFDAVADRGHFLVAYPDGFLTTWNAGDCCGAAKWGKVDDVGFLTKLIDKLESTGLVDPDRVYVTGFSNGAGMAYRMACLSSAKIAAIGVVEGALVTACDPKRKVSVLVIHGTADRSVPYNGGGTRNVPTDKRPYPSVSYAVNWWRRFDDLAATKATSALRPSSAHTRCATAGGALQVALCTITGGTHAWSNTTLQWAFFRAHPST